MTQLSKRPKTAGEWRSRTSLPGAEDAKVFRSNFPNLPGFRKSSPLRPQSPKGQSLNFVNGFMMVNTPLPREPLNQLSLCRRPMTASAVLCSKEVTDCQDVSGRYSFSRKKGDRENNALGLPFSPSSQLPSFIEHDRRVLLFNAFFEEEVLQSALETTRIHVCDIFFYAEDGTLEIIQKKQENSGIPQGVFLRRSRVIKPKMMNAYPGSNVNEPFYEIDDFKIGNVVAISSREFMITSCNESTKQYVMKSHGWHEVDVAPIPLPYDRFAEVNKEKMKRESGKPGVNRNRKMHDLKQMMETRLGKQTDMTDRGMFLECGQRALCFKVVWDDRERLYGDLQFFKLFYFLADDTIEILPVHRKNNGRDQFPKLLKRSKLPMHINGNVSDPQKYYTWSDLSIGKTVSIFSRPMLLARCDAFTRNHYESKGLPMSPDMPLMPEGEVIVFERQTPPYNGFGSEEDSLRSCSLTSGINPHPPKKDLVKMRDKRGVILRYNANLLCDMTENHRRRFVIQYFMEDDTIAIREPPIKNSGVMGGAFLRRQELKKTDGTPYRASDMYVGNEVEFISHKFVLLNADEFTYRLMENDKKTFPFSDFGRVQPYLQKNASKIKNYFVATYRGDGTVDIDGFTSCCLTIGLQLNEQELLTLWRKIDERVKGKVSFAKIIRIAEQDASTQMWGEQASPKQEY
mmetsp:Transcript_18470/g.21249  ORF Transcript_18470/g.21249 Transcript_18470/m.21249 type:complete len:685 (+) Transcript_18470:124-2178(+)